ncbi:MAG: RIP metalloprotease RseP, partial [Planktomarina sp.]
MFDLAALTASFGGLLWTLVFFIVALSIIVFIHEYGHYIVGRWSGIKAEVFSIGFGPILFGRTDKHGTYWQVAALPLGGYVKFKGDANAASAPDVETVRELTPAERRETIHGAPLWARAATAAAGPVSNFIFTIIMFTALFMVQGQFSDELKIEKLPDFPTEYTIAEGDEIIAIDGQSVSSFASFRQVAVGLAVQNPVAYSVERDGAVIDVTGPYPYPAMAASVNPQSGALAAGMKAGDVIETVNGEAVFAFTQLQEIVAQTEGEPLTLGIWRAGERLALTIQPRYSPTPGPDGTLVQRWLIGISLGHFFEPPTTDVTIGLAFTAALDRTWSIITTSLQSMRDMIVGRISACNLSGPVTIAETSGQVAAMGTITFLGFIAVLSTAIGLMNLFPIPMLDGGHLVFYAYEAISGRPPSEGA